MYRKVLVAADLSPASEGVLHCAKGLIPLGGKKAILVHAIGIQRLETMAHGMAHFLEPHLMQQKPEGGRARSWPPIPIWHGDHPIRGRWIGTVG